MSSDYTAAILDELRAMNRKLESQVRAFSTLAERVQLAIGDMSKPEPATTAAHVVGQVLKADEPPIGSRVQDIELDEWWRGSLGWGLKRTNGNDSWEYVLSYAPLTVIEVGNGV